MRIFSIIKAIFLLFIACLIVIPAWINNLNNGRESISVENLIKGNKKTSALELDVSGKLLFDYSCKHEDFDRDNKLKNVNYYIPIVPNDWNHEDKIDAIIVFDAGKRNWDEGFNEAVEDLEMLMDSLKTIKDEVTINVDYKRFDFFKFPRNMIECFDNKHNEKINRSTFKLVHNEKHSLQGKIFVTVLIIILSIILYKKIKNPFMKKGY